MEKVIYDSAEYVKLEMREHTISIQARQGSRYLSLYFTREEVRFAIESEAAFTPWFDDLGQLVQFGSDGIYSVPSYVSDSEVKQFLPFRWKELKPLLEDALMVEFGNIIDITYAYNKSKDIAVPKLIEVFSDPANELIEGNELLAPYVKRLQILAEGYSRGQDDPATLYLNKEDEKNLYFEIWNNKRRCLNGGVIWHETSKEYGIHT